MKVLAIVSQKGGVGKTTLATSLAVEATTRGHKTTIFDLDPQASASFWMDMRAEQSMGIATVVAARLPHFLKAAKEGGAELLIIDTPPFSKDVAHEAAAVADFVLMPTRPAILDLNALTQTIKTLRAVETPFSAVLTFCPPQGREVEDTATAIAEMGATVCPVRIGNRIAYSRSQQTGQSAQELTDGAKAGLEIKHLYDYVCIHLDMPKKRK